MAKIYVGNYKAYLAEIQKLQTDLYVRTDQILPIDPQHLRTYLNQTKPTSFNQDRRSIFALMGRDKIIEQNQYSIHYSELQMLYFIMLPVKKDRNLPWSKLSSRSIKPLLMEYCMRLILQPSSSMFDRMELLKYSVLFLDQVFKYSQIISKKESVILSICTQCS